MRNWAIFTTQQRKKNSGIPKGISEQKPGKFLVQFRYNSIRYNKFFSDYRYGNRATALLHATEWMHNKKEKLHNHEESSETKC